MLLLFPTAVIAVMTIMDKTHEQNKYKHSNDERRTHSQHTNVNYGMHDAHNISAPRTSTQRHARAKEHDTTTKDDATTTMQRSNQTSLKEEGTTNTGKPKACEVLIDHCPGITHEHKSPKFSTDTLRSFVSSALVQPNSDRHEREQRKNGRESVSSLQGDYIEDSYEHNGNKTTATEAAGDTGRTAAVAGTAQVAEDSHTVNDDSG